MSDRLPPEIRSDFWKTLGDPGLGEQKWRVTEWAPNHDVLGQPIVTSLQEIQELLREYLRVDGSRSMAGNLDLAGFNVTNTGTLNATNITAGALTATTLTADSLSATGSFTSVGDIGCGDVIASGNISCVGLSASGTLSCVDINSSGDVSCVDVSAQDITATGGISGSSLSTGGTVSAAAVTATGTVSAAAVSVTGNVTCVDVNASGNVTCVDVNASGAVALPAGSLSDPSLKFVQPNTGLYQPFNNSIDLVLAGSLKWRMATIQTFFTEVQHSSTRRILTNQRVTSFNAGAEEFYDVDATSGPVTATLPAWSTSIRGRIYTFKKIDSSGNEVTVQAQVGEAIDGINTYSLASQWDSVTVVANWSQPTAGGEWYIRVTNVSLKTSDKTSSFTAGFEDYYACDCTSAAITATLPALSSAIAGRAYRFKKVDSSSNALTIDGDGTDTIDGAATQVISFQYDSITVVADSTGSDWLIT